MKWIPISRLPKRDALYIVHVPTLDRPYINTAWYDPKFGWSLIVSAFANSITHWMGMPKPPKKYNSNVKQNTKALRRKLHIQKGQSK